MKRIVNGVTYNTDTSSMLARWEWEDEDHNHVVTEFGTDVLYQTRGGAFFLHKEKTKHEWDEAEREHVKRVRHEFVPLSPEQASKWLLEGDVEVINNPFDDPPEATAEAEPGATLYIRVPAALKRRVDEAASNAKVSGNVWAMRCVERCLEPNPDAKVEIATAYEVLHNVGEEQPGGGPVSGWLTEAVELLETAWGDLGFDDRSGGSISDRIMALADKLTLDRLRREYPLAGPDRRKAR